MSLNHNPHSANWQVRGEATLFVTCSCAKARERIAAVVCCLKTRLACLRRPRRSCRLRRIGSARSSRDNPLSFCTLTSALGDEVWPNKDSLVPAPVCTCWGFFSRVESLCVLCVGNHPNALRSGARGSLTSWLSIVRGTVRGKGLVS